MPNMRIIYNNAADRATLTASSSVGALVPANLKNDLKSAVWRSATAAAGVTPSARLDLSWGAAEMVAGVALAYCNLTPQALVRVTGSLDNWQTTKFDSGWIAPCPAPSQWPAGTMGANSFAYGASNLGRAWLSAPAAVTALRIEITDAGNPGGYIEVSRLVCGGYWEPAKNPDYGASLQPVDASTNSRNDAGDLMSDAGTRSDKLSLSMSRMNQLDRAALLRILRGNGITKPVYISLFPGHADALFEQDHQLVGKLVETAAMSLPSYNIAAATLQIESI
jgi:hypothetical protein